MENEKLINFIKEWFFDPNSPFVRETNSPKKEIKMRDFNSIRDEVEDRLSEVQNKIYEVDGAIDELQTAKDDLDGYDSCLQTLSAALDDVENSGVSVSVSIDVDFDF